MSTRTSTGPGIGERPREEPSPQTIISREYALSKAAQILLANNITSESRVLEAYFILVREQRKGNIEYPVDYEFVLEAIKFAKKLKSLRKKN